jgi:pimeloyl-ACP methyl ester carboxylesterase
MSYWMAGFPPTSEADGTHLVGHSSGAAAAMLAAALRRSAMLSLTLCEPPAFQVPPAKPKFSRWHAIWRSNGTGPVATRSGCAVSPDRRARVVIRDRLPPPLVQGVRALRAIRLRPWECELPVDRLAAASLLTLVISGGHSPALEAVCDHRQPGCRPSGLT